MICFATNYPLSPFKSIYSIIGSTRMKFLFRTFALEMNFSTSKSGLLEVSNVLWLDSKRILGKTLEATELMKKYVLDKSVWFLFQTTMNETTMNETIMNETIMNETAMNEVTHISLSYRLHGVSVQHLGLKESLISAGFGSFDPRTDFFRVNFSPGRSYPEPTAPKVNDVFTGVVSHVDSPDCFYINRASDKEVIDDEQKSINDFFSDEKNRNEFKLFHFIIGMACIGAFSEDGMLYRAIIEGVNESRKTCTVRFVDYGNKEQVPVE